MTTAARPLLDVLTEHVTAVRKARTMPTAITLATVDPTEAEADVVADAIAGAIVEVYPEDADPVWVNPTTAVVISAAAVALILDAAEVALDGYEDVNPDADPTLVAEAFHAIGILRANHVTP